MIRCTGKPSRAMATAGALTSANDIVPYSDNRAMITSGEAGTSWAHTCRSGTVSWPAPRKRSIVAAAGAVPTPM